MIWILIDPSFSKETWCISLLDSLTLRFKEKRLAYRRVDSPDEMDPGSRYVFVLGADEVWIRSALLNCSARGMHPILICSENHHTINCRYSTICSDVIGSMRYLLRWLRADGREHVALYGVNPASISDQSRLECFVIASEEQAGPVFYNEGSLEECFAEFRARGNDCDAVICVNSYAAISLVRRLRREEPDRLCRLRVIGYQEVRMTRLYANDILTVGLNYTEYGKAAVMLMDSLRRNPALSHLVVAVRWDVSDLERVRTLPKGADEVPPLSGPVDHFGEDPEVREMMRVERLLCECEEEDKRILSRMLRGDSYMAIADECFFTVSTVKYRVKRMLGICGLSQRGELLELLRRYLPEENSFR